MARTSDRKLPICITIPASLQSRIIAVADAIGADFPVSQVYAILLGRLFAQYSDVQLQGLIEKERNKMEDRKN